MTDVSKAMELLELGEKWLEPFDVTDPFSNLQLEGYLSLRAHSKISSHFRISASSHLQLLLNREILEIAHYFCGFTQSQQVNLT